LLIDTWHFSFGASTWAELEAVPVEKIAYIQFSDASELTSDDLFAETINRRAIPGAGTFDLDRFATTLLANGFDGYVSLEFLNSDILTAQVLEELRRAQRAMAGYWSRSCAASSRFPGRIVRTTTSREGEELSERGALVSATSRTPPRVTRCHPASAGGR